MKSQSNPSTPRSTSAINARSLICAAAASASLLITSACTTSQQVAYSPGTSHREPAPSHAGWYQVTEQPPTYYPIGLSKDSETDYRHGDWVRAGDDGTRWFVPVHGVGTRSAKSLRSEALAMATPGQKVNRAVGTVLDNASDLVGAAASAYSFLAGGEGPEEIVADEARR